MLPPGCPIRIPADQSRLRLPAAFRSLLRPSSPDGAKASVVCPYTLDRKKRISPGPGVYVAILSTQKLCSFQGTSASAAPPCGARGTRGQNLQDHTSETPARGAVVGVTGIGPVTSSLSGTRSNQLSYTPGVGLTVQTVRQSDGRVVARSSGPLDCQTVGPFDHRTLRPELVEATGIGPATSGLQSRRSAS